MRVLDIQLSETSWPTTVVAAGTTTEGSTSYQSTQTITISPASTPRQISTHNQTNSPSVSPSEEYTTNSPTSPRNEGPTNLKTDEKRPTVMPTSTMTAIAEALGGSNSAVIPAVSSAIVFIVITILVILLFVHRRRWSRDPKTTGPNDVDPNLYSNPVYSSKEDGFPIPDLLVGTKPRASFSVQMPHPPPDMSNQYEEFEGGRNPAASGEGPEAHGTSCKGTSSEMNTLDSHAYNTLENPSYQGGALDEEDYHTYEQAHEPPASKEPNETTNGGYQSLLLGLQVPVEHNSTCKDTTSDIKTLDSHAYYALEDPSYQGAKSGVPDEEDYHTYEQAHGPQASNDAIEITKGQTETGNVYQDLNKLTLSMTAYSSLGISGGESSKREQSGGIHKPQNDTALLHDDEEYNRLTFNQSSDITRALKKPRASGDNANDGYGVLDLPEDQASSFSPNSLQLHNDDLYNSLNEPFKQHNDDQRATHSSSGYQALKPCQTNNPTESVVSPQGHSHKVDSISNRGSNESYQSLSLGEQCPRPNAKVDEVDRQDAESEYHNYQDPSQMNQQASYPTPRELDGFSNDKYNILNSGKQVREYHVYQETDDARVDEGDYEDLDPKTSCEEEYSTIDQNQNHTHEATEQAGFEPIYSAEVYSEFQ